MSQAPTTVYDILQIPPGDRDNPAWVNQEFEAVVSNVRPGSGRVPTKALLSDAHNPNVSIKANFFGGRNVAGYQGKVCLFSGQGIKMGEYNGTPELTIGDKASINVLDANPQTTPPARTAPAGRGPVDDSRGGGQPPDEAPPARETKPAGTLPINGQTVGMAMKEAIALVCRVCENAKVDYDITKPTFWQEVYVACSDIIRVSRMLETGKLAPSAKDRADPEFEKKQAAAKEAARVAAEEAERKRKEAEEAEARRRAAANQPPAGADLDEDVPF